jgi:hypothetical protein
VRLLAYDDQSDSRMGGPQVPFIQKKIRHCSDCAS